MTEIVIEQPDEVISRSTGLLWGMPGCGKTTFLSSLPPPILYVMIDPDGKDSIPSDTDYTLLDLSMQDDDVTVRYCKDKLPTLIKRLDWTTGSVAFDSLTIFSNRALNYAVQQKVGAGKKGFEPTIEEPGQTAYGARRQYITHTVSNVLRATAQKGYNCWFTTHQGDAEMDEKGNIIRYTMMLGGKATNDAAIQISECWWMREYDGKRSIAVRNCRNREPMKTRMFDASKSPEFELKFNPSLGFDQPHSIATWHKQWLDGGRKKMPLPT